MADLKGTISDAELLARYVGGNDSDAFAELVRRHIDLVYSTAVRCVRDAHLAEDVTQTVFFILTKKAAKLSPKVILAGWFYQTTRFLAADALKLKARRERYEKAAAMTRAQISEDQTFAKISPHIESAIDSLGRGDREVILLHFFEGLEASEMVPMVGATANTISKRLQRAKGRLRKYFLERRIETPMEAIGPAIFAGAIHRAPQSLVTACAAQTVGTSAATSELARRFFMRLIWPKAVLAAIALLGVIGLTVFGAYLSSSSSPATTAPPPTPVMAPATSSLPISDTQLAQTRQAIYTLRYYLVFNDTDNWVNAMRTLVEIGRPAVPELVAELDRANRDATIRALAFTLRAIGDPRACPALIRAINRTPPFSSDYGILIADPKAKEFMKTYGLDRDPRFISFNRAITLICAALQTITHHNEGRPMSIDARSDTPSEIARSKRLHEELSSKWQTWWNAHHEEFVTDSDLATVDGLADDSKEIEAAGTAAYGQLFPTGAPYHLGPVHELVLHEWDERLDTTEVLDFDREQKLSLLEVVRQLPTTPSTTNSIVSPWALTTAEAQCSRAYRRMILPKSDDRAPKTLREAQLQEALAKPDPSSEYHWLSLLGGRAWYVDNALWDSAEKDLESGKTLVTTAGESDFDPCQGVHQLPRNYPCTFLFRTKEGGAGIVQLLGSDEQAKGVHLLYRMVEPSPVKISQPQLAPIPDLPDFGPTRECSLKISRPDAMCAMDIETGKLFDEPNDPKFRVHLDDWLKSVGANVFAEPIGLALTNMRAFAGFSDNAYDTLTPGMAVVGLDHLPMQRSRLDLSDPSRDFMPATAAFRLRDGTIGMIQVVAINANSQTVMLRYKLMNSSNK